MSLTDEENFLLSGLPTSEENTRQDERTVLLTSIEEKVKGLDRWDTTIDGEMEKHTIGPLLKYADVLEILEGMK